MAYSREIKREAIELYAVGDNAEVISRKLQEKFGITVAPGTVRKWKEADVPEPWDAYRAAFEEKVRQEAIRRLAKKRSELAESHLDMWNRLRKQVDLAQFEQVMGTDGQPTGEMRPKILSPFEVSHLAAAASKVQTGERTVLGENAYNVGVEAGGDKGLKPGIFIPPESDD